MLLYRNIETPPIMRVVFDDNQESLLYTDDQIKQYLCNAVANKIMTWPNGLEKTKNNIIDIAFLPEYEGTALFNDFCHGCNNLESNITIPNTVYVIGNNVFSECYKLKEVTFSSNLESIGSYFCFNAYGLSEIDFTPCRESLRTIYASFCCQAYNLKSCTVNGAFKKLEYIYDSFLQHTGITKLDYFFINDSRDCQLSIGKSFLWQCDYLQSIRFGDISIDSIPSSEQSFASYSKPEWFNNGRKIEWTSLRCQPDMIKSKFPDNNSNPWRKWQ